MSTSTSKACTSLAADIVRAAETLHQATGDGRLDPGEGAAVLRDLSIACYHLRRVAVNTHDALSASPSCTPGPDGWADGVLLDANRALFWSDSYLRMASDSLTRTPGDTP